jgi:hypothetical protein
MIIATLVTPLLSNPEVQAVLVGGVLWLVNKMLGKRKDTKAGKALTAIAIASEQMLQYGLTEPNKTPTEVLIAFKGIAAIQFAKVGFTESDRAPYQPLIDAAISKAVTLWVKAHPDKTALTMPITKTLAA